MVSAAAPADGGITQVETLLLYKEWANRLTFEAVLALPDGEALKPRPTRFGNMVHTLNHVFVIDDIFRAHLEGRRHGYTARNTDAPPRLSELYEKVRSMDAWYLDFCRSTSRAQLRAPVEFEFIGGGRGRMTGEEILLHVVNHGTYHRGFVSDMMYQVPAVPPANDLTVFLREHGGGPRQGQARGSQSVGAPLQAAASSASGPPSRR